MAAKKDGKKMAAKKAAKKTGKKAGKKSKKTGRRCREKDICKHLEKLDDWFDAFMTDYKRLRIAVCNVEKKAWSEAGSVLLKRFCNGGPNDPPDPAPPPKWT